MFKVKVLLLVLLSSDVLLLHAEDDQVQNEEFQKQLQDLEEMIFLVRNARSVTVELEEDEDDQEIIDVMDMVDLNDPTNVDAVAEVLKTLSGGKQMEFLMTKFMMGRADSDDSDDSDFDYSPAPEAEKVEEPEPMLSRQRRFVSQMFSYFAGEESEPEPEPEPEDSLYTFPERQYEPFYPSKAPRDDLHRNLRSPRPEPEPASAGASTGESTGEIKYL